MVHRLHRHVISNGWPCYSHGHSTAPVWMELFSLHTWHCSKTGVPMNTQMAGYVAFTTSNSGGYYL